MKHASLRLVEAVGSGLRLYLSAPGGRFLSHVSAARREKIARSRTIETAVVLLCCDAGTSRPQPAVAWSICPTQTCRKRYHNKQWVWQSMFMLYSCYLSLVGLASTFGPAACHCKE